MCHSINRRRGLISPNGRPRGNTMRAMLSQPHIFYHQILPIRSERLGSEMLRPAYISRAKLRQLEYFSIPIVMRGYACLIAVPPLYHIIELANSTPRDTRTICKIFNVIVRFLVCELGSLSGPRWRFLHDRNPQ